MALVYRWAIDWTEFDAGWGQRPDGSSIFETREEAENAIAEYWASERRRNPSGVTPSWYIRPSAPYRAIVDDETNEVVGHAIHQ